MIKLSERLLKIAERIGKGETIADIGTDHGFLPFYLYGKGISPKVILCDISPGSMKKAKENARLYLGGAADGGDIDFRTGDGLSCLDAGEVDDIVIAGLGAQTMIDILTADADLSRTFSRFILQPRKDVGELRQALDGYGFVITDETLVREGRFICEIITARPGTPADRTGTAAGADRRPVEWEVPAYYGERKDGLSVEYVERKLEREKRILRSKISGSEDADTAATEKNIGYIRSILRRMTGNENG